MCDLAIASENSRFATSGINFGLFCSTPAVGISRVMQPKKAFDMLVTGDFISAEEAARRGLINQSVPKDNLDGEVLEKALRIAAQVRDYTLQRDEISILIHICCSLREPCKMASGCSTASWRWA